MATDYILSAPGSTNPVLTITTGVTGPLVIPTLQDVTVNAATDVYSWAQLNEAAKLQVPTTSTNSISTNIVVEDKTFFGDTAATAGSAAKLGLMGLSVAKTLVDFEINLGAKTISGQGYITGLSPTVSADSPVWVTPVSVTCSGEYVIA